MKYIYFFVLIFILTSCEKKKAAVQEPAPVKKEQKCSETSLKGRYILSWKNGKKSVVEYGSEERLKKDYFSKHGSEIESYEEDVVIRLGVQNFTKVSGFNEPPNLWGVSSIGAESAWEKSIFGENVIVAVVDSGLDATHPQLKDQLAINPFEIPSNGIDDDGNGFVDDVTGFNFITKSNDFSDDNGHGTHVSGIIVADSNFGEIKGVAPKAKILPLKFLSGKEGQGKLSDAIMAIEYAATRGARVINASWGGGQCSPTLKESIDKLSANKILFVSAAGNEGKDIEREEVFPASLNLENQITVAASTQNQVIWSHSNYGQNVHVLSPGVDVYSTVPGGYAFHMGTSMAAPFVSGHAALIFSVHPEYSFKEVKNLILNTVSKGNYCCTLTSGQINIKNTLDQLL